MQSHGSRKMLGCPEKNLGHGVKEKRDKTKKQGSEAQTMGTLQTRGKCLVLILSGGEPRERF